MVINKLIVTKSGAHYWRTVKNLKKEGVFIVEMNGEVTMFHNKRVVPDFGSLMDVVESLCLQRVRDSKIERLLK